MHATSSVLRKNLHNKHHSAPISAGTKHFTTLQRNQQIVRFVVEKLNATYQDQWNNLSYEKQQQQMEKLFTESKSLLQTHSSAKEILPHQDQIVLQIMKDFILDAAGKAEQQKQRQQVQLTTPQLAEHISRAKKLAAPNVVNTHNRGEQDTQTISSADNYEEDIHSKLARFVMDALTSEECATRYMSIKQDDSLQNPEASAKAYVNTIADQICKMHSAIFPKEFKNFKRKQLDLTINEQIKGRQEVITRRGRAEIIPSRNAAIAKNPNAKQSGPGDPAQTSKVQAMIRSFRGYFSSIGRKIKQALGYEATSEKRQTSVTSDTSSRKSSTSAHSASKTEVGTSTEQQCFQNQGEELLQNIIAAIDRRNHLPEEEKADQQGHIDSLLRELTQIRNQLPENEQATLQHQIDRLQVNPDAKPEANAQNTRVVVPAPGKPADRGRAEQAGPGSPTTVTAHHEEDAGRSAVTNASNTRPATQKQIHDADKQSGSPANPAAKGSRSVRSGP
jgi:hypothetical protein